jgi:hypothetical protein
MEHKYQAEGDAVCLLFCTSDNSYGETPYSHTYGGRIGVRVRRLEGPAAHPFSAC